MRRNRRIDPKSFDLTTECPECHYKIPPNELLRVDGERMRCPHCKQDVLVPTKGKPQSNAVPE
jgi:DNA-directed RNA polymerase subunit RPC12/RpoP